MAETSEVVREERSTSSIRRMDHVSLRFARWQSAFWAVMFGAGESSLGLLGTFLQAPPLFFGLMAAIPQVCGPLTQVFAANLMDRWPRRKALVIIGVLGQSLAYLPLAVLSFFDPNWTTYSMVLVALAGYFTMGNLSGPPWTSFISDLVPSSRRGVIFSQFGRIQAALTLVSMLGTAAAFWYADHYAAEKKAWFFATIFVLSCCSRLVGTLLIAQMHEPEFVPKPESAFSYLQFISRARESNFVKFVLFASLFNGACNISGPYFLPYCKYGVKFAEWQWLVINSSATFATIISLLFWGKFTDRFGNKRTLKYSGVLVALQPLYWLVSDNFYYLVGINMFSGMFWAGFNLAAGNYILEACSAPVRARCVAYYTMTLGAFVFVGSMIGSALLKMISNYHFSGNWLDDIKHTFMYLLWISAATRLLSVLIFVPQFKELREVRHFSLHEWFFENVQSRISGGIRLLPFGGGDEEDD
jgi:MFS family permease